MKKKTGTAKAGRRRVGVKDLAAKKGGVKGGQFGAIAHKVQKVQKVHPGRLTDITDGTSNTL